MAQLETYALLLCDASENITAGLKSSEQRGECTRRALEAIIHSDARAGSIVQYRITLRRTYRVLFHLALKRLEECYADCACESTAIQDCVTALERTAILSGCEACCSMLGFAELVAKTTSIITEAVGDGCSLGQRVEISVSFGAVQEKMACVIKDYAEAIEKLREE